MRAILLLPKESARKSTAAIESFSLESKREKDKQDVMNSEHNFALQ